MKKKWLCRFLGFFAACGAALAGFAGIQRLLLFLAQKKDSPVPFEEQFRSSQGEIACRSMGHGRPLLLVHSMMPGASSAEWEPVLDALAEHYHVYAIDLLGFGHSFRPEKPWTAYQYANLLHEFIQDAVRRPVHSAVRYGAGGGSGLLADPGRLRVRPHQRGQHGCRYGGAGGELLPLRRLGGPPPGDHPPLTSSRAP